MDRTRQRSSNHFQTDRDDLRSTLLCGIRRNAPAVAAAVVAAAPAASGAARPHHRRRRHRQPHLGAAYKLTTFGLSAYSLPIPECICVRTRSFLGLGMGPASLLS